MYYGGTKAKRQRKTHRAVTLTWRRRLSKRLRAETIALVRDALPGCPLRDSDRWLSIMVGPRQSVRLTLLYLMTEAWTRLG